MCEHPRLIFIAIQVTKLIDGEDQNMTQLSRPAYFGELGLMASSGSKRSASCLAVGVTELLHLKYDDFKRIVGERVHTIKWKQWIGEADRRRASDLVIGYHQVVSRIYETMLARGITLFQEISSHGRCADRRRAAESESDNESITASNICDWLVTRQPELVVELEAVSRTPNQAAQEISLHLGDTQSNVVSLLHFTRNLPQLAIQARKLCVCDDMRMHRCASASYVRIQLAY